MPGGVAIPALVWAATRIWQRLRNSGAPPREVGGWFPGVDAVPGGRRAATTAVVIDAPRAAVRSALLESLHGGSTDDAAIAQRVVVGDRVATKIDGGGWVAVVNPEHFVGVRTATDLWGRAVAGTPPSFVVERFDGVQLHSVGMDRTRVVVSGYETVHPGWLRPFVAVAQPARWIAGVRWLEALRVAAPARRGVRSAPTPAATHRSIAPPDGSCGSSRTGPRRSS